MNIRRQRLLLNLTAGALLTAAAATTVWVFAVRPAAPQLESARAIAKRPMKLPRIPALDELSQVTGRRLRGPLYDPPPRPKPVQPPAERKKDRGKKRRRDRQPLTSGGLRLIGTVLEDGKSMAILQNGTRLEVCAVGMPLKLLDTSLRVESIQAKQVTLTRGDRKMTLSLQTGRR